MLSGPDVELRFSALAPPPTAELVDTVWVLETLFVGDVASSPRWRAGDARASLGRHVQRVDRLPVVHGRVARAGRADPSLRRGAWTAPNVRAELSQQDSHVVSVIGDGFVPSVEGDLLTLTDPGGVGLVYRAEE